MRKGNNRQDYVNAYLHDLKMCDLLNARWSCRLYDRRFKFLRSLRLNEYYYNSCKNLIGRLTYKLLSLRHKRLCNKFNWTIPINVFGPGLAIVHVGSIVVSPAAKVGKNCRIHVGVSIGNAPAKGKDGAPTIGDNVYFAPGVKVFGPVIIGDNVAIGANSVVNSSFPDGNCTIAGIPAKKISDKTSSEYIIDS